MSYRIILSILLLLLSIGILGAENNNTAESDRAASNGISNTEKDFDSPLIGDYAGRFSSDDEGKGLKYISSFFWNDLNDFLIDDRYAYCAVSYGLIILDVRNGLSLDTISTLYLPSSLRGMEHIEKNGNILYFARYYDGVYIIDVTDKTNPVVLSLYPTKYRIRSIGYDRNLLYMAEQDSGLTIIDVSEPDQPEAVGTYTDPDYLISASAHDGIALTSAGSALHILNVKDPANPELIASYEEFGILNAVLEDTIAYVMLYQYSNSVLQILNLSDPYNPKLLSEYIATDDSFDDHLILMDSLAFFGSDIINIKDLREPHLILQYRPYPSAGIGVYDNKIFVARLNWINVYDLNLLLHSTQISESQLVGSHYLAGYTLDVIGRDYLANDTLIFVYIENIWTLSGIFCVDVRDINAPKITDSLEITRDARLFDIQKDLLYAGKHIIDISNPTAMKIIGEFGGPFANSDVADISMHDTLAFLVIGQSSKTEPFDEGLYVYDVSNPTMPIFLSQYDADISNDSYNHNYIEIRDTIAYLATHDGLHIINYSDPVIPGLLSIYDKSSLSSIAVSDSLAYLVSFLDFRVVDISDPTDPVMLGIYDPYPFFDNARGMALSGNYAYLATRYKRMVVMDVSNPFEPTLAEIYRTPSEGSEDLYLSGRRIYLADHYGLMVLSKRDYDGRVCGDINADGSVDISDAIHLINYIFTEGTAPEPLERAELNCDSEIDIADIIYVINYVFLGGNNPCDPNGDGIPDC